MCPELQVTQKPTRTFQDNAGGIGSVEGGSAKYLARRKHIDVGYQNISDMVETHEIVLIQEPILTIKVDLVAKSLRPGPFKEITNNSQITNKGWMDLVPDDYSER